jgi:hypothetical protein
VLNMPNRRQQIKGEGLRAYRERQAMRRMMDDRNPYGSQGGYVTSGRRGDGLMMDDMRSYQQGNYHGNFSDMVEQNQPLRHDPYMPRDYGMNDYARREQYMAKGHGGGHNDYGSGMPYAGVPAFYEQNGQGYDMAGGRMRREMGSYQGMDGHHLPMQGQGMTYYPIEAMGTFNGYYGMNQHDFGRGQVGQYSQGSRRRDYGDYGETLSEEDLEKWCKKLKEQLDDREKQMFSKEAIMQRAKQTGRSMEGFGAKELEVATLMIYTDYKQSIGQNIDLAVRLAFDWLTDKDAAVKGAEKLAIYHDCIIEGDDD